MRGWQVRVLYGPLNKISVSYDTDILLSVQRLEREGLPAGRQGSGNGSFPFGVTEVYRGLEGGSPIERRRRRVVSVPIGLTFKKPHTCGHPLFSLLYFIYEKSSTILAHEE